MRSRLLVREDAANPLEHRLPVLRGHLRELLTIDLVESLSIHRAQRECEDLLDPVRGHAQHAVGVEEGDPVRVGIEHGAQLSEPAIGLGALMALDVALPRQLGDEPRVADRERRAARERVGEIDVFVGVPPALAGRGEQQSAERFRAVEHRHHDRGGKPDFLQRLERILGRDGGAKHLVGDLLGDDGPPL